MKNYKSEAQLANILLLVISLGVISLGFSSNTWRDRKNDAYCYPVKVDQHFPLVHFMPSTTAQENSAKLYNFILKYIQLTKDRSLENFRRGLTEKTQNVATSEYTLAAISYSRGPERQKNVNDFYKSSEEFFEIKESQIGYRFNVEGIEYIKSAPGNNTIIISVVGEYQVDEGNESKKSELWGYRRVTYRIVQGAPLEDTKVENRFFNKDGYYVFDSYEENISQREWDELSDINFRINHQVD